MPRAALAPQRRRWRPRRARRIALSARIATGGHMNLQELQTLIDYHYWARDRLLEAVEPLLPEQFTKDLGNSFPSVRDTLVHLYGADWIWCSRWEGESPSAMPEPAAFPDV